MEEIFFLNTGYSWDGETQLTKENSGTEQQRHVNIVTSLLLRMRGKVQAAHEELLKRQKEQIIVEEEAKLKDSVLVLNECSDNYFSKQFLEKFQVKIDEHEVVGIRDFTSSPFSTNSLGANHEVSKERMSISSEQVDDDILALTHTVGIMIDTYMQSKKQKALLELDSVFSEMINGVEIAGEAAWKKRLQEVKRVVGLSDSFSSTENEFASDLTPWSDDNVNDIELQQLLAEEATLTSCLLDQRLFAKGIAEEEAHSAMSTRCTHEARTLFDSCQELEMAAVFRMKKLNALINDRQTSGAGSQVEGTETDAPTNGSSRKSKQGDSFTDSMRKLIRVAEEEKDLVKINLQEVKKIFKQATELALHSVQ